MSTPVVIAHPQPASLDELRTEIEAAFLQMQRAIAAGAPVMFVVLAGDLLGHGSVFGAAYANAVVGLTRAAAFEGAKANWRVNVAAVPDGAGLDATTADSGDRIALTGQLLTFGSARAGKAVA